MFSQQLDEILWSLQSGAALSSEDKVFLQTNANRVNQAFPAGITSVLRSIHANSLPPGGIRQVQRSIQALKLSLSIHENELAHLERRRASGENVGHLIATNRTVMEETFRVLYGQQEIAMSYEQHENRLQAISQIQEYMNSL